MTKLLGSLWATQIFLKNFQGLLDAVCGGFAQIAKAPFFMCLAAIRRGVCLSQQASAASLCGDLVANAGRNSAPKVARQSVIAAINRP